VRTTRRCGRCATAAEPLGLPLRKPLPCGPDAPGRALRSPAPKERWLFVPARARPSEVVCRGGGPIVRSKIQVLVVPLLNRRDPSGDGPPPVSSRGSASDAGDPSPSEQSEGPPPGPAGQSIWAAGNDCAGGATASRSMDDSAGLELEKAELERELADLQRENERHRRRFDARVEKELRRLSSLWRGAPRSELLEAAVKFRSDYEELLDGFLRDGLPGGEARAQARHFATLYARERFPGRTVRGPLIDLALDLGCVAAIEEIPGEWAAEQMVAHFPALRGVAPTIAAALQIPASLAQLAAGSSSKFAGGTPPPPLGSVRLTVSGIAVPISREDASSAVRTEDTPVPETARQWVEESSVWVAQKQRQGRYLGRNGYEALRFLRKCGVWVSVFPSKVGEAELRVILSRIGGTSPKTRRYYLSLLSSFLAAPPRLNEVVKHSGFKNAYKNRPLRTPVLPGEVRDRILDSSQGPERVIVSFLCSARRPVEILRARTEDLDLARGDIAVRAKGGRGDVTDRVPLNETVLRELRWYLPLRSSWAERAAEDSGHLVCRWDGERLVGVSIAYLRRALEAAERRAKVPWYPLYSFRRGAATLLRDRGAEWEDIRDALTHRSIGTTEGYVKSLRAAERAPAVVRLLDAREAKP
jgi:integrase